VKKGDYILVDYVTKIKETGETFDATIGEEAKKGGIFKENTVYEPMFIVVGEGWVMKKVEESKQADFGFDALTMEFRSMLEAGILDPAKVTRSAVQNAASIGMMVLTTEGLVTDIPEEKKEAPGMPPGGMGGMDY